jgi:hypothetical protein
MKIGFFDSCLEWIPHLETDLELMDLHLSQNDEVFWFNCHSDISFCQPNPYHKKGKCRSCIKRKNKGLSLLNGKVTELSWKDIQTASQIEFPIVHSINDLKSCTTLNFDIGVATASSLVSVIRDSNPDLVKYETLWKNIFLSSYNTYKNVSSAIVEHQLDRVYTFNGRFAPERAVLRACQATGTDCYIHERGNNKNHYMVYENSLPHNRKAFRERMEAAWNNPAVTQEEKLKISHSFFEDRIKGKEQFWVSFVNDQTSGLLPEKWDENKTNIAIFTSSEDELSSISDEWKNTVYDSQIAGIKKILEDAPPEFNFYLRIHPNLIGVNNIETKQLVELNYPNLVIIPPSSKVNTYSLIKQANKVVVFSSTVGVEATYLGTPCILAGISYYRGMDAAYDANSHEELIDKERTPPKK